MSDDGLPGGARDKDALLYDYSKHLLSLALLAIGGIVSLAQSPLGRSMPGPQVVIMLAMFAISGACALSCSSTILRAVQDGVPVARKAWRFQQGAMLFLGAGVGSFLAAWVIALA